MDLMLKEQRDFDRIELVAGLGDRRGRQICIMSLVAWLAGEGHTDQPATASRFISAFAIPLNDGMPSGTRQQLKVFAPRIVGTNDGRDAARLGLLRDTFLQEVLPRIRRDEQARRESSGEARPIRRLWMAFLRRRLRSRIAAMTRLLDQEPGASTTGCRNEAARVAGKLLVLCAVIAPDEAGATWYWNLALRMLDEFCDTAPSPHRIGQEGGPTMPDLSFSHEPHGQFPESAG